MKICGMCHKKRLFVKNRDYMTKISQFPITSKNKICWRCDLTIKKILKKQ